MKTVSIKCDNYLINCITGIAQQNKISISAVVRDILYNKMETGQLVKLIRVNKTMQCSRQNYRSELGYIIFTAKLLEALVLASYEQGEELIKAAFASTKDILEQLQVNNHKGQFCINLEPQLYDWLSQEANRLKIRVTPLIRKIIEEMAVTELKVSNYALNVAQKAGIEHQLLACKLLEVLISKTIADGVEFIEEARSKTRKLLSKLFGEQSTASL